jgi:hypothetical protein
MNAPQRAQQIRVVMRPRQAFPRFRVADGGVVETTLLGPVHLRRERVSGGGKPPDVFVVRAPDTLRRDKA